VWLRGRGWEGGRRGEEGRNDPNIVYTYAHMNKRDIFKKLK
jgi:hypothetical protein